MCNENDFRIVKQICVVNVHPLFKFNGEKKYLHNILNFYFCNQIIESPDSYYLFQKICLALRLSMASNRCVKCAMSERLLISFTTTTTDQPELLT